MIEVRQVTNPLDPAVGRFGALQRRVYFEADMLIPPAIIRVMIGTPMTGRANFLVVAEEGGKLLGGTFFHHLKRPNTGFSSFMGVAPEARGRGVARKLHEERFRVLDRAAGGGVSGVFIDVVAPERMSDQEKAAERRVGSDPTHRRRAFHALGFRRVGIPYAQPVGGPGGGPVTNLDLLYCPSGPAETVPLQTVLDTMLAYWAPWLGGARARTEVEKLRVSAPGDDLPLLPAA